MDIQRIRLEVAQAATYFALVEAHPTTDGGVFVKAALQTPVGNTYIVTITFPNYPNQMPKIFVARPALQPSPHQYNDGTICYLHPNMWNPGSHNLTFVLRRAAKWFNKYEVYRVKRTWPGAELKH
jgi:hypothetical protein